MKFCPPRPPPMPSGDAIPARGARAIAALNHPNIVTIHSVEEAGPEFLTMELVDGKTLRELLTRRTPLERLLEIAIALADAMATAHAPASSIATSSPRT